MSMGIMVILRYTHIQSHGTRKSYKFYMLLSSGIWDGILLLLQNTHIVDGSTP